MTKKATANVHIRIPAALKREAEKVINALGLDISSAIRLFFTQLALQQTLPFPLPTLRQASAKTKKIVNEALSDGIIGPFENAESALKALYAAR
jgi:addiction module RelB/DinJ family antitoxin